ncbi:MAG: PAS domain S-box protein [Smithella sp.]
MTTNPKASSRPKKNHSLQDDLSHLAKAIIANAGIGIYIVQNGKFVYVSELYQKLSGYTETELLGTYSLNYIYSDDTDMVRDEAIKCLKGESFEPYEYRFVKKNNEIMWVLETITPIVYKEERATLGSFMDITGRKKVEEKLHKEEQRFRALAEQSSDIIVIVNRERVISYENPAIAKSLGLKPEERIGANVFDNIHPDDFNIVTDAFNTLFGDTNAPAQQIAVRLRNRSGGWNTFEAVASNLVYDNIVEAVMVNLRDITERKRAEETLRISEERFRGIASNLPGGVFQFFVRHNGEMGLNYLSENARDLLGLSNDPQKYFPELVTCIIPEEKERFLNSINEAVRSISRWNFEGRYIKPTGEEMYLRGISAPIEFEDKLIFNGVILDMTERKQAEEALRESEDKYRTLIETTDTGYVIIDQNGLVRDANSEYVRLTGHHDLSEIAGRSVIEWTAESQKEKNAEAVMACFDKGYIRNFEIDYVDAKGSITPIEINATCIEIEGKKHTITICRDISQRKHMEEKIRHEERRFRALVENSSDIIVVLNAEGTVTYENPAFEKVLGFKSEERIGANGFELVHPDDLEHLTDKVIILFTDTNDPVVQFEVRLRHKDGSWRKFEAVGSNLVNNNVVESIIVNYRDINERKKMEDALLESERRYKELSIIDDLTQLYNSRHFYAQLEREIERTNRYKQPFTLMMIDLDKFKDFNDTYGHVEGDSVLSKLGSVIKRCLRETDSAYRYGGEEFTIMLPMTTSDEGMVTAQRIQTELRKEVFLPDLSKEASITVSIGVAQYKPKEVIKAFINRADKLMYRAKENGRNRIFYESQQQEQFKW